MHLRRWLTLLPGLGLVAGLQVPGPAAAPADGPQTFVIGVDHADPLNQQLDAHGNPTTPPGVQAKVFEYTDFFTRSVKVHSGDTLDFRFAVPDHMIAVAPNEAAARLDGTLFQLPPGGPPGPPLALPLFPLFRPDETTGGEGNAIGSRGPKVEAGLANLAAFAFSPSCGQTKASACVFGGSGPSAAGWIPPGAPGPDWFVNVNAPAGTTSTYFCHFHPGMRGTLTVVPDGVPTQTQARINQQSQAQFLRARATAQALYDEANQVQAQQENNRPSTHTVHVGVTSRDRHIAIHDMLPAALTLAPGDIVHYQWQSNVIHTVGFTNAGPPLLQAIGADCFPSDPSYVDLPNGPGPPPSCIEQENGLLGPIGEVIGDPGTTAPGRPLTLAKGADSGLLLGADYAQYYGAMGASRWSITASDTGAFIYKCTIHDWMTGTLTVASHAGDGGGSGGGGH